MACKQSSFEFLCESFPQIDVRIIKATLLEHGDDIESAINFFMDDSNEMVVALSTDSLNEENIDSEANSHFEIGNKLGAELPKVQQTMDLLSLFGTSTETSTGQEQTVVPDHMVPASDDLLSLAPRVCSSFGFCGQKLPSPGASISSSMGGQMSWTSELSPGLSSCDFAGRISECIEENSTPHTPDCIEISSQGCSAVLHTPLLNGVESIGKCCEYTKNNESWDEDFLSGNFFEKVNVAHSDHEDSNVLGTTSSSFGQNISIQSLQDVVEEARADKELLMKFIEDISILRAKADQENCSAQRAKIDAVGGGQEILLKAEEMRKKIAQMGEDNLVRAGEIYGEKAVLGTEARELRSRLDQVKCQKNKAVARLHEIQAALQARLDVAVKERERAEEEKRRKEENAQKIMAMEEALMAIVAQESRELEIEASVCTQLREFLINHGSIVDSLQGEMAVICEDVEAFKEQVEEGMWSTFGSISWPSGVMPEGPYSFRRSNRSSATSSQELGQKVPHQLHRNVKDNDCIQIGRKQEVYDAGNKDLWDSSLGSSPDGSMRVAMNGCTPSVCATRQLSNNLSMPEPSADITEIQGRDHDAVNWECCEAVGTLKPFMEMGVDPALNAIDHNNSKILDHLNNYVYETAKPNQIAGNPSVCCDLERRNFQDGANIISNEVAAETNSATHTSNQLGSRNTISKKTGITNLECNSQSDDDGWHVLTVEKQNKGL